MKRYLLPLILILLLIFTLPVCSADLYGTYDKRIKLTIDNTKIDATLSNFPATVKLTLTQGEEIFTEFDADSDYMKCAFTASDGSTQLYAEKEAFSFSMSQYPPAHLVTYVKATSTYAATQPYYATDPTKSLTGDYSSNSWLSNSATTNQRFHIDLGSAKVVEKVYYENFHTTGGTTNAGTQNFTFWGSNTGAGTFDDLVWGNDEGWTQLTISQSTFDEHTGADTVDPKYITVTNTTAYRYYAFKFADNHGSVSYMGVRRIELQAAEAIYHVKVTSIASDADTDIYYYYDNDASDNTTYIGAIDTAAGGSAWDEYFKLVSHQMDATTSTIKDSTSNNNDVTKKGANEPKQTGGKVGKAQDFDGSNDYMQAPFAWGNEGCIEMITNVEVFPGTSTQDYLLRLYGAADDGALTRFETDASNNISLAWYYYDRSGPTWYSAIKLVDAGGLNWSTSEHHHIAFYWSDAGNELKLYADGVEVANDATWSITPAMTDSTIDIASDQSQGNVFNGRIDEYRYSTAARAAAWVKATYNSLWDTLLTYGSEETGVVDNAVLFGTNL